MKNITNTFNEIIIRKTLSSQQSFTNKNSDIQFSSLIDNNSNEEKMKEEVEIEEVPTKVLSQQLELENINYLNKVYLSLVA